MTIFVDSSAVVKLYVPEPGHEVIRRRQDLMVVASVTRVEVVAAFWRKHRIDELAAADAATLAAAFEADLDESGRFATVSTSPDVLRLAVEAVARHGLRAYDAVQLGTALAARGAVPGLEAFGAFDRQLRRAAEAESFEVVPANL